MQVLGVGAGASDADLRQAKRKLALLTHPDKCSTPGASEAFQLVTKAAETLLEPSLRHRYDCGRREAYGGGAQPDGPAQQPAGDGFYVQYRCASVHPILLQEDSCQRERSNVGWCVRDHEHRDPRRTPRRVVHKNDHARCEQQGLCVRRSKTHWASLLNEERTRRWCGHCQGWHEAAASEVWAVQGWWGKRFFVCLPRRGVLAVFDITSLARDMGLHEVLQPGACAAFKLRGVWDASAEQEAPAPKRSKKGKGPGSKAKRSRRR